MSEQLREALSAAMDNEADAFELRRVLDESSADPELREQWHRMHLARSILRDEEFFDGNELRQRIWAEMEGRDEDTSAELYALDDDGDSPASTNWIGRVTGSAVALGVALLVVFSAGVFDTETAVDPSLEVAHIENTLVSPVTPVLYTEATPQDRRRLDALRMHHYQQNALNKAGAVSFIRMVTFKQTPVQGGAARTDGEK